MIEIKGLRKSFGKDEVLKGIDLSIDEKEVVVIIGPSGSGKSTLLRCMNHLEEPTAGEVIVDGITLSSEANINKVREEVGMVFQRFNLFPHMTVLENIMLAPMKVKHVARDAAEKTARELLMRTPTISRAVSNSAWQSPVRLPCIRRSCFSMSRPQRSIRRWSARCSMSCVHSRTRA